MKRVMVAVVGLVAVLTLLCLTAAAQTAADPVGASISIQDTASIPEFFLNLATQYPWIATALLIIGGLRVVFKPLMALIDGYVKANCSADEYAKLQTFEAGPVYKWLNFGLDFVGSVKLPVLGVKPVQK